MGQPLGAQVAWNILHFPLGVHRVKSGATSKCIVNIHVAHHVGVYVAKMKNVQKFSSFLVRQRAYHLD